MGRACDLAALERWLADAAPISCRCVIGRAGVGKTRLAIELCEQAEAGGWSAGFLRHDELVRFARERNLDGWMWGCDTLIVVDYAAASARVLRQWLEALARRSVPPADKLRLLLLERHGEREGGWWAERAHGRPVRCQPGGLIRSRDPGAAREHWGCSNPTSLAGRGDLESGRMAWATPPPLPEPGRDPVFDELADDSIHNEPLYLLMAGLVALDTGAPTALALGRLDLAYRVAAAERDRLDRVAGTVGIDVGLFRHLVTCITLQSGCNAAEAVRLVDEERQVRGDLATIRTADVVAHLADALPVPGTGDVDAVRPDLIGEAFVWTLLTGGFLERGALREGRLTRSGQCAIIERAHRRAGAATLATVIRAAQDLAEGSGEHASVAWLAHLARPGTNLQTLRGIADELPGATVALLEQKASISSKIVNLWRPVLGAGDEERASFSRALNNCASSQARLGDVGAARRSNDEAVEISRALALSRPAKFRAGLAIALCNLSIRQSTVGDDEAALRSIEEAVAITRAQASAHPDTTEPDFALMPIGFRLSILLFAVCASATIGGGGDSNFPETGRFASRRVS